MNKLIILTNFFIFSSCFSILAQHHHCQEHEHHQNFAHTYHGLGFIANKGQFHENVSFQAGMGGMNKLFIEKNTLTYLFFDEEASSAIHDLKLENPDSLKRHKVPGHSYKVHFKNALKTEVIGANARSHYQNYFLGNDRSKWASKVPVYNKTIHKELYSNIDLECYSSDNHFKYDFIIKKGGNPNDIILEYEGANRIYTKSNFLLIETSVGTSRESQPYSYQIINGKEIEIPCEYRLQGNQVTFHFPKGYNKGYDLIIDPVLVGATLSGTTGSENFGHTATYDAEGNIYTGGISFGVGYPTTTGAFDHVYHGGTTRKVDMVFSKYNSDGSNLIYATYIGGDGDDYPHSTVVNANGQLCILGSSNSQDFPSLPNSYRGNNGGDIDITVTKLNASGTALIGVTHMGGNGKDGVNLSTLNTSYGDRYRGEIILDNNGDIYVASTSSSVNFPVTPNAFQTTKANKQDGVVFKLNSDLSTLYWSTYIGSSGNDTAGGIKIKDDGRAIVVGTAGGANFPMGQGGVQPTWAGGAENAYVMIFSQNGQNVIYSTYWGTSSGNEHAYFVDIDEQKNIHVYGTTTGTDIPVTDNTYSTNNGAPQYITAFNSNLSSVVYSTTIGLGPYNTKYDFVPSAFLVDKCNSIYFSGYYAKNGLPTSSDAFLSTSPQLKSFYIGVLEPNATALSFGTYYGNANHVDGGTSRFDKSGVVYQGVCSCKSTTSAPDRVLNTTIGAWAPNQAERCDVGVFKIDFERPTVIAEAIATPGTSGCTPFDVNLKYTGQGAETFEWSIGGEVISTEENAAYLFTEAGSYEVMLAVSSEGTCNMHDTTYLQIDVLSQGTKTYTKHLCTGQKNIFLDASLNNATYNWQDGYTGATYTATQAGIYWVDISLTGCGRRDSFLIKEAVPFELNLGNDTFYCHADSVVIDASHPNAISYEWSNQESTSQIMAHSSGTYSVIATDGYNCTTSDTISIRLEDTPVFEFADTSICEGDTIQLQTNWNTAAYEWSDGSQGSALAITQAGEYWLALNNKGCLYSDTMMLSIHQKPISLAVDSISCATICNGEVRAVITPDFPADSLSFQWNVAGESPSLENLCEGTYTLTLTDQTSSCQFLDSIQLVAPDTLFFETGYKHVTCYGDKNGHIVIKNVRGGRPPYQYFFEGDSIAPTDTIRNLPRGAFDVWIRDTLDCEHKVKGIFIDEPYFNLVEAGENKNIELGDSVKLDGYVLSPTNQYSAWSAADGLWCRECIQTFVAPLNTTTYTLTTLDTITGCKLSDDVTVYIDKPRAVFIPNVFTPNGDGQNDIFTIHANQGVEKVNWLRIYDRWGEVVFKNENFAPNQPEFGWDGKLDGKIMNSAVFVYYIEITFKDGEVKKYVGDVTLMR